MPIHNFDFHLGVDMTGLERTAHFRTLENLWRRHGSEKGEVSDAHGLGSALERTAGFRRLLSTGEKIYSLFECEADRSLFIHAGKSLYRLTALGLGGIAEDDEEEDGRRLSYAPAARIRLSGTDASSLPVRIYEFLPERPIAAAAVGNSLYFADGMRLYCYRNYNFTVVAALGTCQIDGIQVTSVTEPYVPLRLLDGAIYEQRNLLTDRYRQSHTFRETDLLIDGNAPLVFKRIGKNKSGIEGCRAEFCIYGDYGNTLVIPSTTIVDGVTCSVFEISQSLLSNQTQYDTLVLPSSITSIPSIALTNCAHIHTVRIPKGVTQINMEFFNGCASSLLIEYEGDESDWSRVQKNESTYKGSYTVKFGYSQICIPYGIRLPEKSGSIGTMFFDGALVENKLSEKYHFYPMREDYAPDSPYTHIYILAHTPNPPYEKTLTFNARALPFFYESTDGIHTLATTEKELKESGVDTGNASASENDTPEGQALLRGCRLLTSYDNRLFFSGLPAIPDVIFYSHEDADGNPNPTYVAALNYQTDGDRMPVTGLYSSCGELCVTHATRTKGKLQTHTYAIPDTANALFLRLYPLKAVYPTAPVRCACIHEGVLHLLTEEGIFAYTRKGSDGYLSAKCVSTRISPFIRAMAARENEGKTPFLSSLGGRLALFFGSELYLGDSVLTSKSDQYEWYPQKDVGSYMNDEKAYHTCHRVPESLEDAFFLNEKNEKIPLTVREDDSVYPESMVEERTAKTFVDGRFYDHTVFCARDGSHLLDRLPYRVNGTLSLPTAAAVYAGLLVFGTEEGALLAYNTDCDEENAKERYYLCDSHRANATLITFPESNGRLSQYKRTRPGSSYIYLRPMADEAPLLTLRQDERTRTSILAAAPFAFDRLNFSVLAFSDGRVAALPIAEPYDYIEKSYMLSSDTPFAFLGLSYGYDYK